MAMVPKAPRPIHSLDAQRRATRAEVERLSRQRFRPARKPNTVHLEPERDENWRPGESWLKTEGLDG